MIDRIGVRLSVTGEVQGVGFRPFVHRLAEQCQLAGSVANTTQGVVIDLEGRAKDVERFQRRLVIESPTTALVDAVDASPVAVSGRATFTIDATESEGEVGIRVPRDLALCVKCLRELFDPTNRRFRYPFTNCTACGPRYSIIERMPYDRARTTMACFTKCGHCETEYASPSNRRFHAEPNACRICGPAVALWDQNGRCTTGASDAITAAAALVSHGRIVALKGLGGFQLLVRANDVAAVQRLRRLKRRPTKPFAVMVRDLEMAERLADLGPKERALLTARENSVVLVRRIANNLPDVVAPGLRDVGLFFPTTPLHALLLAEIDEPIVATSGNQGEEPLVVDERDAVEQLGEIANAFLVHNRPIRRGVDDSVVAMIDGRPASIRLARGYAPLPLPSLERFSGPPILALGGHQKAAIAIWNGRQAVLGPHIGDLDSQPTRAAFETGVGELESLYRCKAKVIVCDFHPDYFTTRFAERSRRRVISVQHHHAHVAAMQVEHGLLDREVLGIAWDGTGFGTDGALWGGEFLRVDGARFLRTASLLPLPLPGGEAAIRRPGRIAFALLYSIGQGDRFSSDRLNRLGVMPSEASVLRTMLEKRINVVWSSSVGRLFDAVAALIIPLSLATYEGEAAIRLEALADPKVEESYELPLLHLDAFPAGDTTIPRGDWRPMVAAIVEDLECHVPQEVIAARFHNTLVNWAARCAESQPNIPVVLSGGCFLNRLLTERLADKLRSRGRDCLTPGVIPTGDGGLAAGQLAVAMARLNLEKGLPKGTT